ncbi:hypothetical protein F7734_14530 [Scytonema sp. UIC 10036]|uniref:hypothetical protein n=1 Tax=Scytonema sp. UIC 10036 TaxID=2304196 RepID=UPI0012DACEB8|nr:hypothetical protein [Scytonema sp. UIC 10036]MUG93574.1 hypothetical protein [Scytonema sp. UIC 10036]
MAVPGGVREPLSQEGCSYIQNRISENLEKIIESDSVKREKITKSMLPYDENVT